MKDDPAIQAVRDARRRISAAVGHDPKKLVEYYRQRQDRHKDRVVSRHEENLETPDESAA